MSDVMYCKYILIAHSKVEFKKNKPEMNFRANVRHKFEIWKTSGKMQ